MGYAWAPQITGLVRGEPKPGQRHRSNGKAILMECCEERASKSPTLDRTRSDKNVYWHKDEGVCSGTGVWDAMCADADAYRSKVTLRDGTVAERGLRKDAVIGWAAVIKPPPEMVAELGMDSKAVKRFCSDGFAALCKIEPRLFRTENIRALSRHLDEASDHIHIVGDSKDKDGRICGNLIDANLYIRINQEFPKLMREKGWPMDDLDMTDWERMKTDEVYRAERTAKRKRQGQSTTQYAKQKAEEANKAAERIITDAQNEAQEILRVGTENAKQALQAEREKLRAETESAKQAEREALCVEKEKLEDDVENLKCERNNLIHETGELKEYLAYKKDKRNREAAEERKAQEEKRRQEQVLRERQALQDELQRQLAVAMCPPSAGGYPQREKPQESVQNAPETSESIRTIPDTPKAQTPPKNARRTSEAREELRKQCAALNEDGEPTDETKWLLDRLGLGRGL